MTEKNRGRNREIIRTSLLGIGINLFLAASKLILGSLANAHAIILDGVNSLSDLISSLLNIICTRVGSRKADSAHPFGYGRMEYVSSLIVDLVIMYVGLNSLIDAVRSILHPHDPPVYSPLVAGLMFFSLIVKLGYGLYARRKGKQLFSGALYMAGVDSMGDSLIAVSVLVGIAVYRISGVDIESWICVVIALLILRSGVKVMLESMNKIIGSRTDPEVRRKVISILTSEAEVLNVSNLTIHQYGESVYIASADVEVRHTMPAAEISALTRRLKNSAKEAGITLTSVGISSVDPDSPEETAFYDCMVDTALKYKSIRRIQGYSRTPDGRQVTIDLVQDEGEYGAEAERAQFRAELARYAPDADIRIGLVTSADIGERTGKGNPKSGTGGQRKNRRPH